MVHGLEDTMIGGRPLHEFVPDQLRQGHALGGLARTETRTGSSLMFTPLKSVTIQINVHYKTALSEREMLDLLQGRISPNPWASHLHSFIHDVPKEHIAKLIKFQSLDLDQVLTICKAAGVQCSEDCKEKIHEHLASFAT